MRSFTSNIAGSNPFAECPRHKSGETEYVFGRVNEIFQEAESYAATGPSRC
jgi:hypothetical protein